MRWIGRCLQRYATERRRRQSQQGQSLIELALFLPLVIVFGLVCVQFAVLFTAYINILNVTRDAARWVAVHPHVIDSSTTATVTGRLPAALNPAGLTLTYAPTCTSLSSGRCASRTTGSQIAVTATYNVASHLFLPPSFGFGSLTVAIPQTLPAYTIFMQVEPI